MSLIGPHPVEMVRRDAPAAVAQPLDPAGRAADRLEPANMRPGESFAGIRIMAQMGIDRIAATIGGRDLGDGAVGWPRLDLRRGQPDDTADRQAALGLADIGIMATPVDAVDDEIAAIHLLIDEPTRDDAADDRLVLH